VLHRDGNRFSSRAASPKCSPSAAWSAQPVDEAQAGDIVAIAGLTKGTVADTFCDPVRRPSRNEGAADRSADAGDDLPVNDSPLAGTEGDKVTSRVIRDRLLREAKATSR
jgi:GTP-binding protein